MFLGLKAGWKGTIMGRNSKQHQRLPSQGFPVNISDFNNTGVTGGVP